MAFINGRSTAFALAAACVAVSACSGRSAIPAGYSGGGTGSSLSRVDAGAQAPADTTSILKKLTTRVVIGSTVDSANGDTGPHSVSIVQTNYGLKKGQLVVCNFADSSGAAGKGTTIEVLDPQPSSSPSTFATSTKIQGCDGAATTLGDRVYAAGLTSGLVVGFDHTGKLIKTYGAPLKAPFADADAHCKQGPSCLYAAEYIFSADATTGGIVSFSINNYGNPRPIEVASGFAVNHKPGWTAHGPSGLSYDQKKDELYIADAVTNTIVVFTHASELLVKDEIVVQPGGKTFKCKYPHTTCGKLVKAGAPLNAPVAMTILPNGNLIAANTRGGNTLVELMPNGTVLATKRLDHRTSAGIFGLAAGGTNDNNTVLFFTDRNSNTLQELKQ